MAEYYQEFLREEKRISVVNAYFLTKKEGEK